jgi:hypothetical protein
MADRICELMIDGEDLGTICCREDMPNRVCIDRWRVQRPDFHDQFARARECLAQAEFDKIKELIENCTEPNANSTSVKIQAYQWRVMKLSPKSFGDETMIEATANVNSSYTRTLDVSGLDLSRNAGAGEGAAENRRPSGLIAATLARWLSDRAGRFFVRAEARQSRHFEPSQLNPPFTYFLRTFGHQSERHR